MLRYRLYVDDAFASMRVPTRVVSSIIKNDLPKLKDKLMEMKNGK